MGDKYNTKFENFIIELVNQYIKPDNKDFAEFTNIKAKLRMMRIDTTNVLTNKEISMLLNFLGEKCDTVKDAPEYDDVREKKALIKKYELACEFLMSLCYNANAE